MADRLFGKIGGSVDVAAKGAVTGHMVSSWCKQAIKSETTSEPHQNTFVRVSVGN